MTTPQLPAHYEAFKTYFENATGTPSLKDFVAKCKSYIIENHLPGDNIPALWSKRFKVAYRYYCNKNEGPEFPVNLDNSRPDWTAVALNVARKPSPASVPSRSSPTPTTTTATTATSSSTSSDSARTVTTEFLAQVRATYQKMEQGEKWKLPSGAYVEDLMFEHGLTLSHENACHSFILDLDDPVWLDLAPDANDRKALMEYNKKPLPEADPKMKDYLRGFLGKTQFKSLMNHARANVFDIETEFDMDWAQSSIETALRLYPAKFFPLSDQTESDILNRIWIFIDRAFDDVEVDVRSGEMGSASSSSRRNLGHESSERKLHGHRADLLLKTGRGEFGCCEAGKADHGEQGMKALNEGGLKAQKMMKDMLWSLTKAFSDAKGLETIGFIISGLKIFTLIMDRPSPYVCRITKFDAMFLPTRTEDFAVEMGALITLVLRMKQVVVRTLEATKLDHIPDISVRSSVLGVRQLPPCATSPKPKPAKRARISPP